jgi:hypothetical protein
VKTSIGVLLSPGVLLSSEGISTVIYRTYPEGWSLDVEIIGDPFISAIAVAGW